MMLQKKRFFKKKKKIQVGPYHPDYLYRILVLEAQDLKKRIYY